MIPPARVLIAVDFSEGARAALHVAVRLAQQCSAELHVLHAVDAVLAGAAALARIDLPCDMREELRQFVATAEMQPSVTPQYEVVTGEAAQVILDVAERERIDLIVIGTRGHSAAAWPALGTTIEQVLRRATTSVLAVPADWNPTPRGSADAFGPGPVLVGLDMSCPAIAAASAACQLATVLDTHVTLVHAVPPPQVAPRWQRLAVDAAEKHYVQSSADLARASQAIQATSTVRTTLSVGHGSVLDVLTDACRSERPACVVLGRATQPQAYGPPGSVMTRLLTVAHVPVLMHVNG